jgi:hypothetical protein
MRSREPHSFDEQERLLSLARVAETLEVERLEERLVMLAVRSAANGTRLNRRRRR